MGIPKFQILAPPLPLPPWMHRAPRGGRSAAQADWGCCRRSMYQGLTVPSLMQLPCPTARIHSWHWRRSGWERDRGGRWEEERLAMERRNHFILFFSETYRVRPWVWEEAFLFFCRTNIIWDRVRTLHAARAACEWAGVGRPGEKLGFPLPIVAISFGVGVLLAIDFNGV